MNLDWLKEDLEQAFRDVITAGNPAHEKEAIERAYEKIRVRMVRELNDALNRIKKRTSAAVEMEREVVA